MIRLLAFLLLLAPSARAETATYGAIELTGLARDSWNYNPAGPSYAMVCNVNGPDGFLSVRSGPGTNYAVRRSLKRLAILTVDTSQRNGRWIRVMTADRTHSINGYPLANRRSLHVEGWAHDGYLCDFWD